MDAREKDKVARPSAGCRVPIALASRDITASLILNSSYALRYSCSFHPEMRGILIVVARV
jgi:hypothetical protein